METNETKKGIKNKITELWKKFKLKTKIILIAVVLIAAVSVFFGIKMFIYNDEATFDPRYLISQIEKSSELTTAKLTFTSVGKYNDKGVPILNRADFRMIYKATVRAGVDVSKIKVEVDNATKLVLVSVPDAEILEAHVHPDTIEYIDESLALFNTDSKEDSDKAQDIAEEKAREEFSQMGFLEVANEQAETLLKGLIGDLIPEGYQLKIERT